jgi:serine protease
MANGETPRRVIVKFRDAVILPYEDAAERHVVRLGVGPWTELAQRFKGIRLDRLFTVLSPERIGELVSRATDRDRHYRAPNLLSFFVIDSPAGLDSEALAAALQEWSQVETAYVDPLDASPAPPGTNLGYAQQTYLKPPATAPPPAPQGAIDAEFAWTQPGGTGAKQKIVDLERGARLDHEDLVARNIQTLHGINFPADRLHGAQVLCVVAAVDNNKGVIGIAYGVAEVAYTCQVINAAGTVKRHDAVLAAIERFMQPGEELFGRVLLLEVELGPTNDLASLTDVHGVVWNKMPMETALADFEMIRLATALGIVVVEAAGNGNKNLDLFQEASGGKFVLSRDHPGEFKDSGAIMVGGSTANYPYRPAIPVPIVGIQRTCFGSRVDCFAWAEKVHTCDVQNGQEVYASTFGGSSSAVAIVAGAALLIQGVTEATLGRRLSPAEMRALLSDPNINTPSANPGVDRIGVMPNLKRILQDALGVAPDLYMRDYVGDTGAVHAGAISLSPDIIVRPVEEADPDTAFGPGTEGDLMLGSTVTAGQDNFVYVRVWNRATAAAATNVTATVFYTSPATLLTADDWKPVGAVAIANVPPNNVMTVSAAIRWPAGDVPVPGHYCFIALVGNAQDPAPTRAAFLNFDNYYAYIRNNNNVTWRNFDIVAAPAPSAPENVSVNGGDPYAFDFTAPGATDSDRYFELAVGSRLPPGSRVWLEAPVSLLGDRLPLVEVDTGRQTARVPIGPHGRTTLPSLAFPAKSRSRCRLQVQVPSEYRRRDYEVYVSQLFEGFEVGRVTWRIVARA